MAGKSGETLNGSSVKAVAPAARARRSVCPLSRQIPRPASKSKNISVTVHKTSIRQGGFVSLHGKSKAAARSADQFADDWDRHQVTVGTAARLVNASAARTLSS
jgi:hypothetical protein